MTKAANGGLPEEESTMVHMLPPSLQERYRVISVASIIGAAHLVAEYREEEQTRWLVNSRIDFAMWNEIYWMYEEDFRVTVESGARGGLARKRKR